jgi:uncharacterized iron-regulated membrane protein
MISKRRLLQLHRWAGLIAAALLLVQVGSGVLIVFRFRFAELADPAGAIRSSAADRTTIARVIEAARKQYPGYEFEHVGFPQTERGVYVVHLLNSQGDSKWVSVDPSTSAVLRAGDIGSFPAEAALQIHYRLLTGRPGLALLMASGTALVTLAITGLCYWYPKNGRLRQSIAINWRAPSRLLLRSVHRSFGIFAAVVAISSGITGLIVASEFLLAPGPLMTLRSPLVPVAGNLDAALAVARAAYPGRGIRDIRSSPAGTFDVFFWAPQQSAIAVDEVSIDPQRTRVVSVTPARRSGALWMTVLPIHSGESFGSPGMLVILLGGAVIIGLAISGPVMWLQGRQVRRRMTLERARANSSAAGRIG